MLVGLHACGNLSEHMLRYFVSVPGITHLAAVGCCYNHIVPLSPSHPDGFPISKKLRAQGTSLSATALMTGCQAPNNWAVPDLDAGTSSEESVYAKRRFYRAVLEKAFHDKGITPTASSTTLDSNPGETGTATSRPVWGLRKGDMSSFLSFARRAMHCLKISNSRISDEELHAYEERYKGYEGRIAILWTLSVLCCKVVESVVAMDRFWFLEESAETGVVEGVDVLPIFDYKVSPRNLMMVARKAAAEVGTTGGA